MYMYMQRICICICICIVFFSIMFCPFVITYLGCNLSFFSKRWWDDAKKGGLVPWPEGWDQAQPGRRLAASRKVGSVATPFFAGGRRACRVCAPGRACVKTLFKVFPWLVCCVRLHDWNDRYRPLVDRILWKLSPFFCAIYWFAWKLSIPKSTCWRSLPYYE